MSVELRPLGVACNIQCQYCYQNPERDAGNVARSYDLDAMKAAVEREGGPFTLFGGEALLAPRARPGEAVGVGPRALRLQQPPDERRAHQRRARPDVPPVQGARRHLHRRARRAQRRALERHAGAHPGGDGQDRGGDRAPVPRGHAAQPDHHAAPGQRDRRTSCPPCTTGCGGSRRWASPRLACTCSRSTGRRRRGLRALDGGEPVAFTSFADLEDELTTLQARPLRGHAQPAARHRRLHDLRVERLRPVHHPRRARRRGPGPVEQLRADQQGRRRFREGVRRGLRAVPRPVPHAPGARRVPGLPVLPHVQGPVPGHGDRRRLAKPDRALRPVEGPVPPAGGAPARRRPASRCRPARSARRRGGVPRPVGPGPEHHDRRGPAPDGRAHAGGRCGRCVAPTATSPTAMPGPSSRRPNGADRWSTRSSSSTSRCTTSRAWRG